MFVDACFFSHHRYISSVCLFNFVCGQDYNPDDGLWEFEVEHFSKYGLVDGSSSSDEDGELELAEGVEEVGEAAGDDGDDGSGSGSGDASGDRDGAELFPDEQPSGTPTTRNRFVVPDDSSDLSEVDVPAGAAGDSYYDHGGRHGDDYDPIDAGRSAKRARRRGFGDDRSPFGAGFGDEDLPPATALPLPAQLGLDPAAMHLMKASFFGVREGGDASTPPQAPQQQQEQQRPLPAFGRSSLFESGPGTPTSSVGGGEHAAYLAARREALSAHVASGRSTPLGRSRAGGGVDAGPNAADPRQWDRDESAMFLPSDAGMPRAKRTKYVDATSTAGVATASAAAAAATASSRDAFRGQNAWEAPTLPKSATALSSLRSSQATAKPMVDRQAPIMERLSRDKIPLRKIRSAVDAHLFLGRSFRVGWGAGGVIVHPGAPVVAAGASASDTSKAAAPKSFLISADKYAFIHACVCVC